MDLTVVLVGLTGCGKSATGNYILGREAFISNTYSPRDLTNEGPFNNLFNEDRKKVTETCELQTSVLKGGQTISVIDTPGFLDTKSELLEEEVKKCIHLARNRIHAILFVVSFRYRPSKEDQIDAIRNLQTLFGENIINYMIVVFTGGVEAFVKEIIHLCEGRKVHFINKIKDEGKKSIQVEKLLSQVEAVISHNGGKPFMSPVFDLQLQGQEQTTQRIDAVEARLRDTTTSLQQQMEAATLKADERAEKYLKEETSELIQRISKSYEEQMTQRLEAVEQRVLDTATRLEQQLAEAHAAQMRVIEIAQCKISELIQQMTRRINEVESSVKDVTTRLEQQAQKNSDEQIQNLKEVFERAEKAQQKNSDKQIQKLKEVLEREEKDRSRSETITDFESSSFHVYDPSTYLLQSAIK